MPPGAVVVGACGAFSCAHLAARASSRARFLCRSEGGGMATAGCAGGRPAANRARGVLRFSAVRPPHTVVFTGEVLLLAWLAKNTPTLVQHFPAIHGDSAQTKGTVLLSIVSSS